MRLQPLFRLVDADAENLPAKSVQTLPEHQARVRSTRGRTKHDPVGLDTLRNDFLHGEGVAQGTGRTGAAVWQQVRPPAPGGRIVEGFLQYAVTFAALFNEDNLGTEKLIQQQVRTWPRRFLSGQYQNATKTESRSRSRRLPAMIGLDCTTGHQCFRTL
jgi:hypothetical protein